MSKNPGQVADMFDGVAKHYDRTNTLLSMGNAVLWRAAMAKAVAPVSGERILDVGAGTGSSTTVLARRGAKVVGVDISPGMVAEARRRHPKLEFLEADAEDLPFPDDEFDAVAISFTLRNIQHPVIALGEMYRVLTPGGRLVVCEFSKPPIGIIRAGYSAYLKFVMPAIVDVASSNPSAYEYLAESIKTWPDQGQLSQWIRGAGFTRVAYRNLTAGVVALHRGRKPTDTAVLASIAKRKDAATRPIRIQPAAQGAQASG